MTTRHIRLILCALLALLGALVIAGWLFGIEALKSLVPGLSTMKFNSALGFILTSAGIALAGSPEPRRRRGALAPGALLMLTGGLTLVQYISGVALGMDELFVRDRGVLTGSGIPGRMSPLTACAWLALGAAIILLAAGRTAKAIAAGHFLSMGAGFVAFLAAAGYAFGAQAFMGIGFYTAIAIHTAVGLLVAVGAVLLTRADEGWLSGFAETPGARALLIRLLPMALLLPLLLGFLLLAGSALGAYNAAFGFALFVPSSSAVLTLAALLLARRARSFERALQVSAAALRGKRGPLSPHLRADQRPHSHGRPRPGDQRLQPGGGPSRRPHARDRDRPARVRLHLAGGFRPDHPHAPAEDRAGGHHLLRCPGAKQHRRLAVLGNQFRPDLW
jgi:hypothetical protein